MAKLLGPTGLGKVIVTLPESARSLRQQPVICAVLFIRVRAITQGTRDNVLKANVYLYDLLL